MERIFAPCFLKRRLQFHRRNFLCSLAAAVILHRCVEVRVTAKWRSTPPTVVVRGKAGFSAEELCEMAGVRAAKYAVLTARLGRPIENRGVLCDERRTCAQSVGDFFSIGRRKF